MGTFISLTTIRDNVESPISVNIDNIAYIRKANSSDRRINSSIFFIGDHSINVVDQKEHIDELIKNG